MAKNTAPVSTTVESTTPGTTQNTATETSNESTIQTLDSSSEGSEPVEVPSAKDIFKMFQEKMLIPDEGKNNSPFLNKSVYGGKTIDGILLLRADGTPVPMQRVSGGPSDHAAFLIIIDGVPKHTFLTKAEYLLIKSTAKPCDLPALDTVVDKYHDFLSEDCDSTLRAYAASRLRMGLTQDGNVKAA